MQAVRVRAHIGGPGVVQELFASLSLKGMLASLFGEQYSGILNA